MCEGQSEGQIRDYGKAVLVIVFSAFLLRVLSILILSPSLTSDPLVYHSLARSLVEDGTYSFGGSVTAYRPPLYPFFLAALYALPGADVLTVRLVQSMIDAVICLLVFRLGRRIYSSTEGVVAAALLAVYTPYILYSQALFSETIFTFILLLLLDSLVSERAQEGGTLRAGVLLGAGVLLKPLMVLFPAVLFVWDRLRGHSPGQALKRTLMVTLLLMVVISPWIVRNRVSLGTWMLTTNGGVNFWIGSNQAATGAYRVPEGSTVFEEEDEIIRNRLAFDEAIVFWQDHPLEALKVIPWKFFFLFSSESAIILNCFEEPPEGKTPGFSARYLSVPVSRLLAVNLPYYVLLLLSLPALLLERGSESGHTRQLLVLSIFFWITVHLVFFGSNRFHMPIMAVLTVFAARTLCSGGGILDGSTALRRILFIVSFLVFVVLWIGEWFGLLLSI